MMTGTTGGPSGSSAQNLAAQELKAMRLFRPGIAQVPVKLLFRCGGCAVARRLVRLFFLADTTACKSGCTAW